MSKERKPRSTWDPKSDRILIDLWRKHKHVLAVRKDAKTCTKIAKEMEAKGLYYSYKEIKFKFHNFTQKYRREKANTIRTGRPSDWPYYNDIKELDDERNRKVSENEIADDVQYMEDSNMAETSFDDASMTGDGSASSPRLIFAECLPEKLYKASSSSTAPVAETKMSFEETLLSHLNNMSKEMQRSNREMEMELKQSNEELLALEQMKINLLEKYVTDAAQVKGAFMSYLKKQ